MHYKIVSRWNSKRVIYEGEAGGTLDMGSWHNADKCGTTHCRAGWAIFLAGKEGSDLEARVGPSAAGALIYLKSCPDKPIPDFYCTTDKALADIRARAQA